MNKTKPQPTDPKQIKQFFADAQKRAVAARKNLAIDPETAYQIAYEAMIKASLALMLSHGQRPRKQLGHHIAIVEFAQRRLPGTSAGTFALFCSVRPHAKKTQRRFLRHSIGHRHRSRRSSIGRVRFSATRRSRYQEAHTLKVGITEHGTNFRDSEIPSQ
jgi:hypothetical protein